MKNFFNNVISDPIFSALLTVLAGVLITVFHTVAIEIVCVVLGLIATILGLINIIKYFRDPANSKYNLLTGLIFGALGITIIFTPGMLTSLVSVAFGIIILYHGIVNFMNTLLVKKTGYKLWYLLLIFALITIIAGILLIVFRSIAHIATVIGVTLIVEGALNTWTAIKVKKSND